MRREPLSCAADASPVFCRSRRTSHFGDNRTELVHYSESYPYALDPVEQVLYSSRGWENWDVEHKPALPEGMPILIDSDLRFEDGPAVPRPTIVLNR